MSEQDIQNARGAVQSIMVADTGLSLADLLARRSKVISPFIVHHTKVWGNAPAGSRTVKGMAVPASRSDSALAT